MIALRCDNWPPAFGRRGSKGTAREEVDVRVRRRARVATIKVRNFFALESVLEDLSVEPAEVLGSVGLPPDLFSDRERVILYSDLGRLLTKCMEATGCDDFGLRVGAKQGATTLGLVGLMTLHSPDGARRLANDHGRPEDTRNRRRGDPRRPRRRRLPRLRRRRAGRGERRPNRRRRRGHRSAVPRRWAGEEHLVRRPARTA